MRDNYKNGDRLKSSEKCRGKVKRWQMALHSCPAWFATLGCESRARDGAVALRGQPGTPRTSRATGSARRGAGAGRRRKGDGTYRGRQLLAHGLRRAPVGGTVGGTVRHAACWFVRVAVANNDADTKLRGGSVAPKMGACPLCGVGSPAAPWTIFATSARAFWGMSARIRRGASRAAANRMDTRSFHKIL